MVVWTYAKDHEFTIVSKDSDFRQMSFTFGHPPKVIWIRRGNCSTSEIESILRDRHDDMIALGIIVNFSRTHHVKLGVRRNIHGIAHRCITSLGNRLPAHKQRNDTPYP